MYQFILDQRYFFTFYHSYYSNNHSYSFILNNFKGSSIFMIDIELIKKVEEINNDL